LYPLTARAWKFYSHALSLRRGKFWFDFSRDGKQLALSRGTQTSDVILIRDFK
jgi:hypothetical protein